MDTVDRIESAHDRDEQPTQIDDGRKPQFERITRDRRLGHRTHKSEGLEAVWRSPEFKVS